MSGNGEPVRGNVPIKPWIVKMEKGVKIVICPYCGRHESYPHDECTCGNKVAMPKDSVKREWW